MIFQKSACIETLYTELPFLERFSAARADGFEFVEFWSWTDKDLDAVKAAADAAGVCISGFNGDAELSLIDPAQKTAYRAFLRRSLDAAVRIGARSVTVHSNGLGEGGRVLCPYDNLSDAVKLCTMFDTLKIAAEWAETCGVRINLEPLNVTTDHPGNFLRHTRTAAELTRLIGSPYLEVFAYGAVLVDPAIGEAGDVDTAVVSLKFANGAMGVIDNSRKAVYGYDQRVEVFGSEGAVMDENDTPNNATYYGADGTSSSPCYKIMWDRYTMAFAAEQRAFAEAVINGTETQVTGEDGLAPILIAAAATKSMKEGRPVKISEIEG